MSGLTAAQTATTVISLSLINLKKSLKDNYGSSVFVMVYKDRGKGSVIIFA